MGSSEVFHWAVCMGLLPGCGPAFTRPPVRAKLPQTGCYRPLAGNLRIDHRPQVQRKQFKKLVASGRFLIWFILLSD